MAATIDDAWHVRPHGPLERLAENLWWVTGSVPGMSLKRTMVVAKMGDGRLVIHNGIAMDDASVSELEALGTPSFLIVPSAMHRLDAPAYKKRYPNLKVLTPRGSRKKVEERVAVDGTYEDFPPDDAVRFETLRGMRDAEGAMLVKSSDGTTVVLNDVMFNMDRKRDPLGFLFTTVLGSAPGPRVSRLVKLLLIDDKAAVRAELDKYAEIEDLTRLVVAHEKVVRGADAAAALRKAASYLA